MPDIVFDGRKLAVAAGANLVDAGLEAGVPIPIFCYHKELGAVGSCRVCAVTVTRDGKTRTVMGCMTEALDGMEVTTLDRESVAVRKHVLEWLMVNHPHDCPICDEGGECQLQDLTIAAGHGVRRYAGAKRTFRNQYLGEFIAHEMNRCIACYRCSRFYQEHAGGRDFGVTGSRDRVYFGRFEDGPLESPFSGNLVELCPTGVFTDKLFRYKSRVWDLAVAPSVCPHCSVGCNLLPGSRHRELQRVRVRENPAVNGILLCDRGQFGHAYVMDPERPRDVRLRGETVDWEAALDPAAGGLASVARAHGAGSVALVGSPRASLESHAALAALAAGPLAGARVSHFDDPDHEARAVAALAALAAAGAAPLEQSDIGRCDALLVAGTSLLDEAPLAALAARRAARSGGRLFVWNAGERHLDDVAERVVPVHPARLASLLDGLAAGLGGPHGASAEPEAAAAASALRAAARPGVLLGTDLLDGPAIAAGARVARALAAAGRTPSLGYVFPGPNGFAAAALSRQASLGPILSDLESGAIRALVAVECDPSAWGAAALAALARLDLLIVLDQVPGPLADAAQVFLPTAVTYESDGIYVNRAGRAQAFARAHPPGLSVSRLIQLETFPRAARPAPPSSLARPAWWALEMLRERAGGTPPARDLGGVRLGLARSHDFWKPVRDLAAGGPGAVLDPVALEVRAPEIPAFAGPGPEPGVYRADRTLGSEFLSRRSGPVRRMAGPPVALISRADAERIGVDGRVRIGAGAGAVELATRVLDTMPPGAVIVPRDVDSPARAPQGAPAPIAAAGEEAHR